MNRHPGRGAANGQRRAAGFTLLELLVAMGIFAIIGAMALGGLNAIVDQTTQAREQMERLAKLQRAMRLITGDLASLSPRYVRDELGSAWEEPLNADRPFEYVLRATRGGWPNPAFLPHRGTLQRFQYRLDDDKLYREYWAVVDHTLGDKPRSEELLAGVRSVKLLFLDGDNEWKTQWPPTDGKVSQQKARPRAIRFTIDLDDWGEIERLIEVPQ